MRAKVGETVNVCVVQLLLMPTSVVKQVEQLIGDGLISVLLCVNFIIMIH